MAQIQSVLHRDNGAEDARRAKHKLDELDADRVAKNLVLFDPSRDEVAALMEKSRPSIPGLGKTENIQNILDKGFGRMFGLGTHTRDAEQLQKLCFKGVAMRLKIVIHGQDFVRHNA